MLTELHFGPVLPVVLLVVAIAAAVSGAVVASADKRGSDRDSIVGRLEKIWLVASIVVVVVLTLQPGPRGFGAPLPSILNPLSRLYWGDAFANTVLYVPLGFVAAVVWRHKPRPVMWATGCALVVSCAIELAQLVLPISRSAQFHDLVFNTLGGLVGALVATFILQRATSAGHRTSEVRIVD